MGAREFVEHMLGCTVRLFRDAATLEGLASGILLRRPHAIVLLTAGHSFRKGGEWTLELPVYHEGQTLTLRLPEVQLLTRVTARPLTEENIDVAWAAIDPAFVNEAIEAVEVTLPAPLEMPMYRGPINEVPTKSHAYGFAAWNRVEKHPDLGTLYSEASFEVGMAFREERDDRYVFELARPHQGDDYYYGASGAPIADESGRIVSIVLEGSNGVDEILGLPLARYAELLDATTAKD